MTVLMIISITSVSLLLGMWTQQEKSWEINNSGSQMPW